MPQFCGMFFSRHSIIIVSSLLFSVSAISQTQLSTGRWLFTLSRPGGQPVYVHADLSIQGDSGYFEFLNDTERMAVPPFVLGADSVRFAMPLFETRFSLSRAADGHLAGTLSKGVSTGYQEWQVEARHGSGPRIPMATGEPLVNLSGRWALEFQRPDGSWRPAVAELKQQGARLTGTIINPSGDYRFLDGAVWGRQFYLTAFDGAHIYALRADVPADSIIANGIFFSGTAPGDRFRARRNANAQLPALAPVAEMKPGEQYLHFRFPDLDSNMVSLQDPRFRDKVVIVQLMGSWCPNCMDETKFLSEFYNGQSARDVEVVSLAYELSTDYHRSAGSLRKFQQRFNVQYPMLITGARSADNDKAAKTLPQLTDIKYFPTTIFIDKRGRVRKVHNGFYGPGAPDYHEAYKQSFFSTIDMLKAE
jgi:peroxiredoxin